MTLSPLAGSLSPLGMSQRRAAPAAWWHLDGVDDSHVAAWSPQSAASLAASYLELGGASFGYSSIDPAIVGGSAPTWNNVNGWGYDGTQFLKTGIVAQSGWTQAVKISGAPVTGQICVVGSQESGNQTRFYILSCYSPLGVLWGGGDFRYATPAMDTGVLAVVASQFGYRNGVIDGGGGLNWVGTNAQEVYLGGLNTDGALTYPFIGNIQRYWCADVPLTDEQNLTLRNQMIT